MQDDAAAPEVPAAAPCPLASDAPVDLSGFTILQVLPALELGGVERGTVEMVRAIVAAGGRAIVASAGGRLVRAVTHAGGEHAAMALHSKNPLRLYWNALALARLIRDEGIDVVHARSRAPAWSAWRACQRSGVPFVTTYHGLYGEGVAMKRRYNAVMAQGDRVIATSRFVARHILDRHDVDPARLRLVPRGVDLAAFSPELVLGPRVAKLASGWNLPDGRPVIMLPGRLTSWKGHDVLIDALARIAHRDAVAVLVGDDQGRAGYSAGLLRQVDRAGLRERVRFAGQCDDMPAAFMLADVVVAPSTRPEAFGRVVIEAQAMGRPVIAADHGGAAETVQPGVNGWLVPPGDAESLAAAIDFVLDLTTEQRDILRHSARQSLIGAYDLASMQARTAGVYRELLPR